MHAVAKSKEELIELLRQNIKAFNSYRKETDYEHLDLSGADLSVANLCRADLTNCNLIDADLGYSYLHSAILKDCNMKELSFGRADMTEADLSGSDLSGADLNNTILYGANLSGIKGKFIILEGAKVREANFSSADLENGNISNLDLNGVNFDKANLKGAKLISSNLSNSLNLQNALFDDNTMWPDSSGLPAGFDPSAISVEEAPPPVEEDTSELNVEFGPGVSSQTQEYEFLDMQPKPEEKEEEEDFVDFDNAITQLESPFERKKGLDQPQEFDELPNFEQFSANQFEDFPAAQAEPGLAMSDSSLDDLGDELPSLHGEEFDEFDHDFESSLQEFAQPGNGDSISSSITQQEFTVQPTTLASNMVPSADLVAGFHSHESVLQPSGPSSSPPQALPQPTPPAVTPQAHAMPAASIQPIMDLLQSISSRLESLENEQKEQKEIIESIKVKVDSKEGISPDLLNKIEEKQLSALETLKSKLEQAPDQEILTKKIDDISALTKNQFARMESKIDIMAQTDPLSQIDTLLEEFTDYVQEENENLGNKVNELITISESVVTLLENTSTIAPEVDLSQVTTEVHQMLTNLESNIKEDININQVSNELHQMLTNLECNIKEDQEKTDQKIETAITNLECAFKENQDRVEQKVEDLTTNLDGFSVILETIQSEVISINESQTAHDSQETIESLEGINQTISSIHETVNKLLELKDDGTAESQVFEALYDFEFRLKLELEKNESKLETLEETFQKAIEKIDESIKESKELGNVTDALDEFKTKLMSEMKSIDEKSIELRAMGEDIVYQIKSSLNADISSVKDDLASLKEKVDNMASTPYALSEIKQSLEFLIEKDANTESSLNNITNLHSNLRKEIKGIIDYIPHLNTSNNNLGNRMLHINKLLVDLDKKFELFKNEPKIDDELRSIFEHLLTQVADYAKVSKENTERLSRKLDAQENELHLTLKELDRRVSKINSMIRNIYKGLDSLIDLVTGNSSPSFRSLSSVQDRSRRDFMPRSKDYEDDIDLD